MHIDHGSLAFDGPAQYVVEVIGVLSPDWSDRLGGMRIRQIDGEEEGEPITELSGSLLDQAALAGLLTSLYELGLTLKRVSRLGPI
jgi:hypothetical protein